MKANPVKSRNPIARVCARVNPHKVHKPRKGKGSYNRKTYKYD